MAHKVKLFYMRRQQQNNVTTLGKPVIERVGGSTTRQAGQTEKRVEAAQTGKRDRTDVCACLPALLPTPTDITPSNKCSNQLKRFTKASHLTGEGMMKEGKDGAEGGDSKVTN